MPMAIVISKRQICPPFALNNEVQVAALLSNFKILHECAESSESIWSFA